MKTTVSIILFALTGISQNLLSQDPQSIAKKASQVIEFESMEMIAILNIFDHRGNVRVREVSLASKKFGNTVKTLMQFLSPPDVKGTSLLIYDYENKNDDMWLYLPSLRRVRRIVSNEKSNSFMGSEFSYADMTRPNIDDFNYKLIGSETIDGKEYRMIESTCKTIEIENDNGFHKRISLIEKNTYLTRKSETYDQSDNLMKVMKISDYRMQANGKYFAFNMEVLNSKNNRRSEMLVKQFKPVSDLDESDFSTTILDK